VLQQLLMDFTIQQMLIWTLQFSNANLLLSLLSSFELLNPQVWICDTDVVY